jgi:hypothetical protein
MVDLIAILRYNWRRAAYAESRHVVQAYLEDCTVPPEGVSTTEALLEEERPPRRQRIRGDPAARLGTCQHAESAEIAETLLRQWGGADSGV